MVSLITPLSAQISASNFHDLTQITQCRVCFNPKRTEKPKAHGFSVRFGLKHTLREVVVVLIANITLRRGVIWDLAQSSRVISIFPCALENFPWALSQISNHTSPQGDVCTKTKLSMLCRELKRLFDSSGKEVLVKQDGVEILLTDSDIDWPPRMQLNVAEKEISGVLTKVFVLDPLWGWHW